MPPPAKAPPAFDLKSTAWVLTALRLRRANVAEIAAALDARFAETPGLFDDEALVLDLAELRESDASVDFGPLVAALRRHGLKPVAAQGGSAAQMAAARAAGLALTLDGEARVLKPRDDAPTEAAPPPPEPPLLAVPAAAPTLVVERPLRSGQRVYARGGDCIVLSAVNVGAEVIADGHIHVYAPLRGRAMAGARGDASARIFSTCMEPQLVSIAGIYRTTETPLPAAVAGQPAVVRLDGQSIIVEPLAGSPAKEPLR